MVGATGNKSNPNEEQELREETEGEASQNSGSSSSSSFLPELNLLFVLLSSISPNSNEDSSGEDGEFMRAKELQASTTCNIARSNVKKKDVIEARSKRVVQRFQTTIKDHRHGRKM